MKPLKIDRIIFLLMIFMTIAACNRDEDSVLLKFLGTYQVNDSCGYTNTAYSMEISVKNENTKEIYLKNFGGYGSTVSARVSDDNPDHIIINTNADNLHITGEGVINNERTRIVFTYETSNNGVSVSCSSEANK
ncbi:hypothetical protein [Chryseobacterium hagamense]|uniref:Lipoprotein n=1 Tax=Chryseobacterium hagamense TaxID=395935 RepID=A0A511YNA0_9FLAO|nr:hypothetical protein [Chryseobacterium hagamense]GEN76674.1 hypothetical protein CHA01nite_24140 [Chryseobacterium hagamense]